MRSAAIADSVRAERVRIISALQERIDGLTATAVQRMKEQIPTYAAQDDPVFLEDMHAHVAEHYRTLLEHLVDGRPVGRQDLTFVRIPATRRARVGVPVEDFMLAFRVGHQVIWDAIVSEASTSDDGRDAALSLARPVMVYIDNVSTHAAEAYLEFQQFVLADAEGERRDLLERLLAGEPPLGGPLQAAAQRAGIQDEANMMVAVACPATALTEQILHRSAAELERTLQSTDAKPLVVVRQSELILVTSAADPRAFSDRLEHAIRRLSQYKATFTVGVSTAHQAMRDLPLAYAEARVAVEKAPPTGGVIALPRHRPLEYLALTADDTAERLVDPRIRTFLSEDAERGGALAETLRAFAAADLNLKIAAERLHVHPNTLAYRIGRVHARTGHDPRRFADLQELLTAIELRARRTSGSV